MLHFAMCFIFFSLDKSCSKYSASANRKEGEGWVVHKFTQTEPTNKYDISKRNSQTSPKSGVGSRVILAPASAQPRANELQNFFMNPTPSLLLRTKCSACSALVSFQFPPGRRKGRWRERREKPFTSIPDPLSIARSMNEQRSLAVFSRHLEKKKGAVTCGATARLQQRTGSLFGLFQVSVCTHKSARL
ncbi:hypothetical protein IF2G_03165 [Cordyceps javanica]|nr:hypothetical protein IF2G_03165 [Cordyceps javanica]